MTYIHGVWNVRGNKTGKREYERVRVKLRNPAAGKQTLNEVKA